MIPSYKIGKTRLALAEILSQYLGEHISAALIETNHAEKNYLSRWMGFTWSWSVAVKSRQGGDVGSSQTMSEFVKYIKSGAKVCEFRDGDLLAIAQPNTASTGQVTPVPSSQAETSENLAPSK